MKCQNCHRTIARKSKFCPHCGTAVVHPAPRRTEQRQTSKLPVHYWLGLLALGALLGIAALKIVQDQSKELESAGNNLVPAQNSEVLEVAREFMCPCGNCSDALDTCSCDHKNGALEVKAFISQQLQNGHKKPHIVEMVQNRYGGLKAQNKVPPFEFSPPKNSAPFENE